MRRWTRLLDEVGALRPDLIALQEVTEPFLEMLRKAPWVRRAYEISDPRGDTFAAYGSVLLSRQPILRREVMDLESEMDRKLVLIETEVAGTLWTVGTVHLESLEASALRARQLEQVFDRLGDTANVLLCGDFNFCSSWDDENDRRPSDFVDVWPVVSKAPGFTVDTELNATRARKTDHERRERFDRVLVRSDLAQPAGAKLLGTRPVKREEPPLHPSDHFGVFARLTLSTDSPPG